MFKARGFQIAQQLGDVLIRQVSHRLELHDQPTLHHQVRLVVPEGRAVLVPDLNRMLLLHVETPLTQTVGQRILINLLHMPVAVKNVDGIGGLPHRVA